MEKKSLIQQESASSPRSDDQQPQSAAPLPAPPTNMNWVYGVMLVMLITGCANTIVLKIMDEIHVHGRDYDYVHPYFQSIIMFFGESLCLVVYSILARRPQNKLEEQQAELPPTNSFWVLGLPGAFDFCGSTIMFIALGLVPASVYQMMRGFIVVLTCLFAVIFLRRRYFRHHWLGVVLVTLGIALVGVAAVLFDSKKDDTKSTDSMIAGVMMLLVSQFFTATQFILEARLFAKYYVPPLKLVGCEGLMGLSITIVFLLISAFIPCPGQDFCEAPYDKLTAPVRAMEELVKPATILLCAFGVVLSISFFNFAGVSVTKYTSAGHRAVVDMSRTVLIWAFFLALQDQEFNGMQLAGFIVLTIGSLVFNEVLRLPFCGLNKFTMAYIQKHNNKSNNKDIPDAPHYIAVSPGSYDSSRLKISLKARARSTFTKAGGAGGGVEKSYQPSTSFSEHNGSFTG